MGSGAYAITLAADKLPIHNRHPPSFSPVLAVQLYSIPSIVGLGTKMEPAEGRPVKCAGGCVKSVQRQPFVAYTRWDTADVHSTFGWYPNSLDQKG